MLKSFFFFSFSVVSVVVLGIIGLRSLPRRQEPHGLDGGEESPKWRSKTATW